MAKLIEEEGRRFDDPESVEAQVREYVKVKATIDLMETRSKELREKLFERLDTEGVEDDKGNILFELPENIEGVVKLEKQRRVSRKLNEPKAEEILNERGLYSEIFVMKPTLDEDALMAAFYEGKITEEELDEMFPASTVWALRTLKK